MFKKNSNKIETIIKTGEDTQPSRLTGPERLKECSLIVAVLGSILLSIALLSFSPADPSWSQTAWGGEIANAGGVIGAWLADTLFFAFGSLAYTLPIIIVTASWVLLRKRSEDDPLDFMLWGTRLLGLTILILTSCALADINFDDIWYFSSGGVIGDVLTSLALPTLNVLGSTLVLLFLWGAGLTLLTGISWLTIVDSLGELAIRGFTRVVNLIRGERDEVIEAELKEVEDFELPKPTPTEAQQSSQEQAAQPRRYNIHMPEAAVAASVANQVAASPIEPVVPHRDQPEPLTNVEVVTPPQQEVIEPLQAATDYAAEPMPTTQFEQEQPLVERTRQLDATIEQLEEDALNSNDMAEQAVSDWQQEPVEQEAVEREVIEQPAIVEEAVTTTQSVAAEDLPWNSVEDEQPLIDQATLESISEQVEPNPTHIEPVISSFDVADVEEVSHPSHQSEPERVNNEQPEVEEFIEQDQDVETFQSLVADAQAKVVAKQNPFLVQQDVNLPKPIEPLPTLELLYHPEKRENFIDRDALEAIARLVESKLADYKIQATVVDIFPGPVITRFELDLAPGVKVSRISSLSMDLARSLSAMAVRVVEVIPGKPYVGLELPNMSRQTVYFSDVVGSQTFIEATSPTTVVLGQDIAGEAVIADIAKMPHVLVAGTTGSGKSVGVNVMILSMLYKASPEDLRFIMIDPKMLELSIYEGIPHLLSEVVTDMKDASNALRWCVGEMERRYKLMSALGVRNIKGFNDKLKMAAEAGHPIHDPLWQPGDSMDQEAPLLEKLPYIVVVVDEFADLMMVVGKKVEELIARLAQKARAAGIHLILATQRPSVDVITGLIKANIPTRVAFTVSTKTDSRTILDQGGAESLLGMGDMLYLPPGSSHTTRVHGAFASDDDVHAVVNNWKARGKPNYIEEIISGDQGPESLLPGESMESDEDMDPLFDQVVEHVVQSRRGSVSGVQRRFKIGYNRAARIVEQLEAQGIVSAPGHNGNREVLAPAPGRDMN
ncbi:DNA translocase FtsK 4TM domain-containing protein [Vibrio sp. 404]|uniref:DNA translocase FtsK n=1 Tax=Vibrio marinisediminis TaxID=2758441 RepID=A0A7W2IT79_9VIBR|nr:DNA translocase FtsK 4TM domain-containing protein [Vibrio marinisediminis]MBA5761752.1 DNA translocase FtsK 4TM domain-containing protein [Vibrio marinisediminis]